MSPSYKRALITGGAGFIGSTLAAALVERGVKVTCYDNMSPYYQGKEKNIWRLIGEKDRFLSVKADVLDTSKLLTAAMGCEVVFHLAAQPGVRYSLQHPEEVARVNVDGTVSLLDVARRIDVDRLVFASSSSVYGNPKYLPVDEKHPTGPLSPYAASKLAAEEFCRNYSRLYGMDIVILRYFSVYGPRQRPDMAIYRFLSQILNGEKPTVIGTGDQSRDFTFVDDIVSGTLSASSVPSADGETFNLGSGKSVTVNSLLGLLIELTCRHDVGLEQLHSVPGECDHTCAHIAKAQTMLGYKPQVNLEEGLRRFIQWFMTEKGSSMAI